MCMSILLQSRTKSSFLEGTTCLGTLWTGHRTTHDMSIAHPHFAFAQKPKEQRPLRQCPLRVQVFLSARLAEHLF